MRRVLAIAGWERCGSTIIANALGSAPGVVTIGEINNIWERGFGADRPCGCGQPFSACEFWGPIGSAAFDQPNSLVADEAQKAMAGLGNLWLARSQIPVLRDDHEDLPAAYVRLLRRLYGSVADHTGAELIVDSSKTPWHAAVAERLEDFEVSILHIVRDPRGSAFSHLKEVPYDGDGRRLYMDRHGAAKSTLAWIYRNRLTERVWRRSDRYLRLRYEDFVASPAESLELIMGFVGLPHLHVPFTDDGELDITLSHNVSGNPVRFRRGPVAVRADDAWRSGLPTRTQRLVRTLTWPHMHHYGYR